MKGSWQRRTAAGLLAGGLLGAGGCIDREDTEGTGRTLQTPIQDKYQPPAEGPARPSGTGGSGQGGLEQEGSGHSPVPSTLEPLGVGLAESYDAPPPQEGPPATGGSGQQGAGGARQGPSGTPEQGAGEQPEGRQRGTARPPGETRGGE